MAGLSFWLLTWGNPPPLLTMSSYKLATSRPTQAVGHPAQGCGSDSDGGATVGSPLAGVRAVSASGGQPCEIPPPVASLRSASGPNSDLPGLGPSGRVLCPSPKSGLGAPDDGLRPVTKAYPVKLKPRYFRIGTWNINSCSGVMNGKRYKKFPYAEELLMLEKLDLLTVTETHSPTFEHSRKVRVLSETHVEGRWASVAVISLANSGWSCSRSEVLIPGHALLSCLHHSRSQESLWLLSVYGDISSSSSLSKFYRTLTRWMTMLISSLPDWKGCYAAGDWNFLYHPEDRFLKSRSPAPPAVICSFDSLLATCQMQDSAGPDPFPRGWSYESSRGSYVVRSRLDRVYYLCALGSPCSPPLSVPTDWSDHHLVYVDCMVSSPRVQTAVPARRLPPVDGLDDRFWNDVIEQYHLLISSPITLLTWSSFKSSVLSIGVSAGRRIGRAKTKNWRAALHGDCMTPEEFDDAILWFARGAPTPDDVPTPFKSTGPIRQCRWPLAAPWAASKPVAPVPSWTPTPSSPWFPSTHVPLQYIAHPCQRPPPSPPAVVASPAPGPPLSVPSLLTACVAARRRAARANRIFMAEHHTSQWYNLSSNKEADERGSRASVSVTGLRPTGSSRASTSLSEMVMVAHSYFRDLHTPEPLSDRRRDLQDSILCDVGTTYAPILAPPGSRSGPFLTDELPALRRVMHNTAPGPDGIPYSFWKSLDSRISSLPATSPPIKPFWQAFLDLANDVKCNGSSRCGFKLANVSLFFKKGDPTLVRNYCPISSMNTDCKLYTNLVNNRLSPWAVSKIHDDQKGFIPGRLITDHTRLASSMCHLACSTGTNGYIVGLDQAKANDCVDHVWLLRVLSWMGVDPDLISCISDVVSGCTS